MNINFDKILHQGSDYLANPGREIATKGWQLWFKSATGEEAELIRQSDKNILRWKPGQAKKMEQYFSDMFFKKKSKDEPEKRGMGFGDVDIDWKPVIMPLAMKKVVPFIAAYTAIVVFLTYKAKKR